MGAPPNHEHDWDLVILRAHRDGDSEAHQLTRSTAEQRRAPLEREGWTVEITTWVADPEDADG